MVVEVDDMYPNRDLSRIKEEFNQRQQARRTLLARRWGFALASVLVVVAILVIVFPGMFDNPSTAWILPVYGGLGILGTGIGLLVSLNYQSIKPFFNYLYAHIYQDINQELELYLDYEAYPQGKQEFNHDGGLFTRFASVRVFRHVSGSTSEGTPFDAYDCTMTTSNGKSQQTHFDGIYLVVRKSHQETLQIRTNGRPALKGVKFDRQDDIEALKVYKPENDELMSVDRKYIDFMRMLSGQQAYKRVYLGLVPGEIHLALWFAHHPARKHKIIDAAMLGEVRRQFVHELELVDALYQVDAGY